MKRELNIYDYLFYLSLLVVLIWVILKSLGIIQTTFWLEYGVPIAGLIFTAFAFYKNILDSINKIIISLTTLNIKFNHLEKDVSFLKNDVGFLKSDVSTLKSDVHILKSDVNTLKCDVTVLKTDVDFLKKKK